MQTQSERSRTNNQIKLARMCRHYPAIGAHYASLQAKPTRRASVERCSAPAKQDQTARFTIEWQIGGKFEQPSHIPPTYAPVARKLAQEAEYLARKNPGRRVRVIRPGAPRAVLCYRFDVNGNALSY